MYNNGRTSLLEKEEVGEKQALRSSNLDRILGIRDDADDQTVLSAKANYADLQTKEEETSENFVPSSTTMQFESYDENDIFEEIPQNDNRAKKKYQINTKGKVLIAVYALVVATIVSLIVVNSRMLKNLDHSISGYTSRVVELTDEYAKVTEELDYVSSDQVIIEKAQAFGMEKK